MKCCYRHASAQAPNPSRTDIQKVGGGLPDPLSEGGATPLWPDSGNTCGTYQGELKYPIGGGGGGSGTPPTSTQGGKTHPPPRRTLQTVVEVGVHTTNEQI